MGDARYEVTHTTEYDYSEPVAVSHHLARLEPRALPTQACERHDVVIDPPPAVLATHTDYFGNVTTFFAVQKPHKKLVVKTSSTVRVRPPELPYRGSDVSWELAADRRAQPFEVLEFALNGFDTPVAPDIADYARVSFPAGRSLVDGVLDLTARIHDQFLFDPKATTVATPLADVFTRRRGVCQDFARFEIACLRTLGIPARYVSGYLETVPPPGRPRLVGADASHAWLSVFSPTIGWFAVDPTNNITPTTTHITLGWGRDYNDVSPIRGVILGGGAHSLKVRVDVARLDQTD